MKKKEKNLTDGGDSGDIITASKCRKIKNKKKNLTKKKTYWN